MDFEDLAFIDQLRQIFTYNANTGEFVWRERAPEMFSDTLTQSGYTRRAEGTCKAWNTKYAGRPAMVKRSRSGHKFSIVRGVFVAAHRAAWMLHYGEEPQNQIDHINGDPSDNRIHNLRLASRVENARNVKIGTRNKTGFLGVHKTPNAGTWYAEIGDAPSGRKRIYLGTFRTKAEAIAARSAAQIVLGYHENHGRR